jgi:hypothetical protein
MGKGLRFLYHQHCQVGTCVGRVSFGRASSQRIYGETVEPRCLGSAQATCRMKNRTKFTPEYPAIALRTRRRVFRCLGWRRSPRTMHFEHAPRLLDDLHPQVGPIGDPELRQDVFSRQCFLPQIALKTPARGALRRFGLRSPPGSFLALVLRPQPCSILQAQRFIAFVGEPLNNITVHCRLDLALRFSSAFRRQRGRTPVVNPLPRDAALTHRLPDLAITAPKG